MESKYDRPLPEINSLTAPFWEYCKKHELRMQFCRRCKEWIWYPKAICPKCGKNDQMVWERLSGKGSIYSYTVIRQVIDNSESFSKDIPFVIALIELDEGPRIYSNIVGVSYESISIGDRVEVVFEDVTNEITLPKFKKL